MNRHYFNGDERSIALSYILSVLGDGGVLSETLASEVDIELGDVFTFELEGVDPKRLLTFSAGGVVRPAERADNANAPITKLLTYLVDCQKQSAATLALENFLARKGDPVLAGDATARFIDEEVIHLLEIGDESENDLHRFMRKGQSGWRFVGAISRYLEPAEDRITRNTLTVFARGVISIIVGAYDGESYLIWEKR